MYRVEWIENSLSDLARIWLSATTEDRRRLTEVIHRIEQALSGDPYSQGESRGGTRRIVFCPPLGITCLVEPRLKTVFVTHVWRFRTR